MIALRSFRHASLALAAFALAIVANLAWSSPAMAQTTPAAERQSKAGPPLWVVRQGETILYLMGTIHFVPPGTEWRSKAIEAALAASDTLVLEVADPDDRTAVAPLLQRYGTSPERPLSSLLSGTDVARLDRAAASIGRSAAQLEPLRPWLAGVLLSSAVTMRGGFDPASGVDLKLRGEAKAGGKAIVGLESAEDQVRMLAGFPEAGQLGFLRKTLDDFDKAPTELAALTGAWRSGDLEAIDAIGLAPMRATAPAVYQAIIVERNIRWAQRLRTMLGTKGRYFVAVGTLHLAGPDSVQNLLMADGIEIERVR